MEIDYKAPPNGSIVWGMALDIRRLLDSPKYAGRDNTEAIEALCLALIYHTCSTGYGTEPEFYNDMKRVRRRLKDMTDGYWWRPDAWPLDDPDQFESAVKHNVTGAKRLANRQYGKKLRRRDAKKVVRAKRHDARKAA